MSASHSTPKLITWILVIIAIAVAVEFLGFNIPNINLSGKDNTNAANLEGGYKITKVVDGDTIDITKNAEKTRVRLLGINTPETVDPRRAVECFGQEASDYAKSEFLNENVSIETDPSQSTYDKYNRLLAYVYLDGGEMINRKLIAYGYAHEYTYDTPYKYQKEFKALEAFAKNEKRGLWGDVCN